jgi:hypothetical protein
MSDGARSLVMLPHFMGYCFGLFFYSTKSAGGRVDFDYYRIGQSGGSG